MISRINLLLLLITLISCSAPMSDHSAMIELEIPGSSATPNLGSDGIHLFLIHTSENQDTTRLFVSILKNDLLLRQNEIAEGTDWFVNWADFSAIVIDDTNPNNLLVHWLQKSALGTYDYDIMISQSNDQGRSWSSPKVLHNDGINAEHGFVSIDNFDKNYYVASWLDGRNTKTVDPNNPEKKLPMSLRAGYIHKTTNEVLEFELDNKVCDCCQTSIVKGSTSALVAYRDRSDSEIRDIVVRSIDSLKSRVIFESQDEWKIAGCPVNGPSLAIGDPWKVVSWYTAADSAEVWLAYGKEDSLDRRIKIDAGAPLGRVDLEVYKGKAYVTWLEIEEDWSNINLAIFDLENEKFLARRSLVRTSSSRRSGFPIFKILKNTGYLAYTKVINADETQVQLQKIKL